MYIVQAAGELQLAIHMHMINFRELYWTKNAFLKYGHEHMVIRNNYVKEAGGDGITAMYALRPLVEHNMTDCIAQEINDRIYCCPKKVVQER